MSALATLTLSGAVSLSSAAMLLVGAATLLACLLIAAPYGRYSGDASQLWGVKLPPKMAWILMESPNLWMIFITLYLGAWTVSVTEESDYYNVKASSTPLPSVYALALPNRILLGCFLAHYVHRTIIFPLNLHEKSSRMPISVAMLAFSYCLWNSFTQIGSIFTDVSKKDSDVYSFQFIAGIALFFAGMFVNIQSDYILLGLRRSRDKTSSRGGYSIPTGALYRYVSCPNYLGEICEWAGFAVAAGSLSAVAFCAYTVGTRPPMSLAPLPSSLSFLPRLPLPTSP